MVGKDANNEKEIKDLNAENLKRKVGRKKRNMIKNIKNSFNHIFIYTLILLCISCDESQYWITGPDTDNCVSENCYLNIDAPDLQSAEGYYHMTVLSEYVQTFTTLRAQTGNDEEIHKVTWMTNKEINIGGIWYNLVNSSSYTDDEGHAYTVLAVWEEFIGDTIKVYSGFEDNCSFQYIDSLEVIINGD